MNNFKWLLKNIAKIILIGVLTLHLIPIILLLTRGCTYLTMPQSYIHVLELPKLGTEDAKKALDYFSSLGYYPSVSYVGWRPIMIYEMPLDKGILGYATPLPAYCMIVLNENMDKTLMPTTLMHEYAHCFNYEHVKDPSDLMYPYNNFPYIKNETIKRYSNEIGKIINIR